MLEKFKERLSEQREKRIEKRSKPWSKKQRIIFLSVFGAVVVYVIISIIVSCGNSGFEIPSFDLSVNGLDIILLCLLGIGFGIFKIRAYFKRRKDEKEK